MKTYSKMSCVCIAEAHKSSRQLPLKLLQGDNCSGNVTFLPSILGAPPRHLLFQFPRIFNSAALGSPVFRPPALWSSLMLHNMMVAQCEAESPVFCSSLRVFTLSCQCPDACHRHKRYRVALLVRIMTGTEGMLKEVRENL